MGDLVARDGGHAHLHQPDESCPDHESMGLTDLSTARLVILLDANNVAEMQVRMNPLEALEFLDKIRDELCRLTAQASVDRFFGECETQS